MVMKLISTGYLFIISKTGTRTWITKGWDFDVESINWADDKTIYFTCSYLGTCTDIQNRSAGYKEVTKLQKEYMILDPSI